MDEDWETEISSSVAGVSIGTSNKPVLGSSTSSLGRGRGYVPIETKENEPPMFMGRGKPLNGGKGLIENGFGKIPGTFGKDIFKSQADADSEWNDNEDINSTSKLPTSGFGVRPSEEPGGFGQTRGFGSRFGKGDGDKKFGQNRRGFGEDSSRGGNRSKGCFKCGEEGHMSRDCPNGDSSSGKNKGCFKCGEEGHMSRDCPNGDSSSGKNKGCFKCGEEGHMSRDCPNGDSSSGKNKGCFKCGEEGHMSRDCPNGGANNNRNKGCFKCGEEGHLSRDCPNSETSTFRGTKSCFKCGESGHISKDCTQASTDKKIDGKPREVYIPPDLTDETLFDSISTGVNFDNYENIPVRVTGNNVPPNINLFQDANIRDLLKSNIQKAGYTRPTPIQKHSIPVILANRDLMACAQTGSGKTAAFLIPIINGMLNSDLPSSSFKETQEPITVILSPTRELAIQIYSEARKFSLKTIIRSCVIYGGTSVNHQLNQLKAGCHILVATPGRLIDFVERGKISFSQMKYFVLDEADRMLDMGFLPSIRNVVSQASTPSKGDRITLMFSATFPPEIQTLAAEFLNDYIFISVGNVGSANTDVEQTFFEVEKFCKRDKLIEILQQTVSEGEKVLVFVETKRTADFVASFMSQKGFPTTSIHGDRLQREREEALQDFRSGRMIVLVATAVAARGLDIKNVHCVINYDLPQTIEEYVHRIGRTGRVGNTGKAMSFYDSTVDQPLAKALVENLLNTQQPVPDWLQNESLGMANYSISGSGSKRFGAKDVRGFKGEERVDGSWNNSNESSTNIHGGGFGTVGVIDEEESWD